MWTVVTAKTGRWTSSQPTILISHHPTSTTWRVGPSCRAMSAHVGPPCRPVRLAPNWRSFHFRLSGNDNVSVEDRKRRRRHRRPEPDQDRYRQTVLALNRIARLTLMSSYSSRQHLRIDEFPTSIIAVFIAHPRRVRSASSPTIFFENWN